MLESYRYKFFFIFVLFLLSSTIIYAFPLYLDQQGVLRYSANGSLINGTYYMFNITLYNRSDDSNVYTEERNITLSNGVWNYPIGYTTTIIPAMFYSDLYFKTKIGSEELSAVNFTAVPYAFYGLLCNDSSYLGGQPASSYSDTNETTRFTNTINTNCSSQVLAYFHSNGTGVCEADDSGAGASDGNASSICGDNEVLLGQNTPQCIDLNATIDLLDDDTTGTNCNDSLCLSSIFNNSIYGIIYNGSNPNGYVTSRDGNASSICSGQEVLLGNSTCYNSSLFFDDTDTNETTNVGRILSTNCTGQVVAFFYPNGTGVCEADTTGASDGNASSICNGQEVLLGNSTCYNSSYFLDDTDTNTLDGNVSSICGDNYVLLGQDSPLCIDFNATVDLLDDDTDTNESLRFNNLLTNCSGGEQVFGIDANGSLVCVNDALGAAGTSVWVDAGSYVYPNASYANHVIVFGYIRAYNWTNVSITTSQIRDLTNDTDTNETTRLTNTLNTNCSGQVLAYFHNNGTAVCETDDSGGTSDGNASSICNGQEVLLGNSTCYNSSLFFDDTDTNTLDGNASSICGDNEVLLGQDVSQCIDFNATVDLLDDDTDTNESTRVTNLIQSNCTGQLIHRFYPNGTALCEADDSGTGLTNGSDANFGTLEANDWSNATITESQISDLSHTTDTNETTNVYRIIDANCTNQVLAYFHDNGTGVCESDDGTSVPDDWVNESGDTMTGALYMDSDLYLLPGRSLILNYPTNTAYLRYDNGEATYNLTIPAAEEFRLVGTTLIYGQTSIRENNNADAFVVENRSFFDFFRVSTVDGNAFIYGNLTILGTLNRTVNCSQIVGNSSDADFCVDTATSYDDSWINNTIDSKIDDDNQTIRDYVDNTFLTSQVFDGNASSICNGQEVLLGNSTCYNSSYFLDDTDTNTLDGNVSSICGDNEVLLGQDTQQCIDLNATIDLLDDDTDTNETTNVYRILGTNCSGSLIAFFHNNGTGVCETDDSGTGLTNGSDVNFGTLEANDWSNATITHDQVSLFNTTVWDIIANGTFYYASNPDGYITDAGTNCNDSLCLSAIFNNSIYAVAHNGSNPNGYVTSRDGNASSVCGDGEVYMGNDTTSCVNLNTRIDALDDDTTYSALSEFSNDMNFVANDTNARLSNLNVTSNNATISGVYIGELNSSHWTIYWR